MKRTEDIKTNIGLTIYKGDWDGAGWTITGFPKKEVISHDFDSAYDFEDCIKRNVNCNGIDFDSEYCQFFVYYPTKTAAESFIKRLAKYVAKRKELINSL